MLDKIGKLVEKHPWLVIGIILLITIGLGTLAPLIEMGTSTEDFMPDDEIVRSSLRVADYFGGTDQMMMIYVEKQLSNSVVSSNSLKEEDFIIKNLEKNEEVTGSISVANFVDIVCQMEFNKTLQECSNEEIETAFQDLMIEKDFDEIKMLNTDDKNEENDYNPHPRITNGKTIDSIDIKNYYIQEIDEKICFSIEVYDLSYFENELKTPHSKMNVMEWYIDFKNLVTPDEMLDINYKITARLEPTNEIWEVGNKPFENIKNIVSYLKDRELFKSYKKEAYLWIKPPNQDMSFPIKLKTGNITFNIPDNRIEIIVEKDELGNYGIAPEMYGTGIPGRIGQSKAGFRFYQIPGLKLPWLRVNFDINFIKNYFGKIQNRSILSSISSKILSKFSDFSYEDFDELFAMMEEDSSNIDTISLKDMETWWVNTDTAPDTDFSDNTFFIKPFILEEFKKNSVIFLPEDYSEKTGSRSTLILLFINETIGPMQSSEFSKKIVQQMERLDSENEYVSLKATGEGVISYQIDEVTTEANMIILPGIFIAICIILFINFRRFSYIVLPLVGLSISIVWLLGTMVILGLRFNTMHVALVPLLMGLGVDYSVHIFHNYRVELENGKTPGEAIVDSIRDIGTAMFLAAITTVIAFLSFLTAIIPPLRDFGILCALGIIYIFIITITLQAAVRYILDRRKKSFEKIVSKKSANGKTMRKTSKIVYRYSGVFLITGCIITVIMLIGAINIETGFDMNDFLPEDNPAEQIWEDIIKDFPFSSQDQEYILIEGNVASVDTLSGISNTYENLKDDDFITRLPDGELKVVSVLSVIQKAVKENDTIISEFNLDQNGIPKNDNDVKRLYDYLSESDIYWQQMIEVLHQEKGSYDATVIRIYIDFYTNDQGENDRLGFLYDQLNEDIADYGEATAIVTGGFSSIYSVTNGLTDSQVLSTGISILLAALVLIIVFRNPILGLITIIPVGISIIWILGSMHFIGYSLNVMTIMVTSLTIGIGIDYAIHATHRFRLVADKTGDPEKAISETIGHTGGALLIAAMSTIAGFGILIFAPIPPEQQFGVIMCLTILYAFLTSIFILPPIIMKWAKWRKKNKGFIISPKKPE